MTTLQEVNEILSNEKDEAQRILSFAALLAQKTGLSDRAMIVVGGSAIEIYTEGAYVSGDIDIVGRAEKILPVLKEWGFQKEGRTWYQKDWKMVVDVLSREYRGDWEHTQVLSTPYGRVRLAAIEDLLVSRLISAKWWRIPDDVRHAELLAAKYGDVIDWEYVTDHAKREQVEDLLAELRRLTPPTGQGSH